MPRKRNSAIDAIKGIAILAVALYHFGGYLPYGYLGVDIFLVIGGYFLGKSVIKQFKEKRFNYWSFVFRKIVRLWPLIILSIVLSLGIGYLLMLPDDYENLAESAIASSVFTNNILQCITTKNYWDVVNLYKPLMHLWYIGVLMQAYVILPLVFLILEKYTNGSKKSLINGISALTLLSFILFLLPNFSGAWKFYYLPFRLYEITAGVLLALWNPKLKNKFRFHISWISVCFLFFLLCSRVEIISGSAMLVMTVLGTLIFISSAQNEESNVADGILNKIIVVFSILGKRSYSIYIWHQVIVAFLFYSVFPKQNILSFFVFCILTIIITLLSYRFIEVPLGKVAGNKQKETSIILMSLFSAICVSILSFFIYLNAGVVRNIPELNIYKNNVHRGMHAEYCDRPYEWDNEFNDNGKIKVLVIGNSFGRDWANILYEWDSGKLLDISYVYFTGGSTDDDLYAYSNRIEEANYLFFATGGGVEYVPKSLPNDKLFVIGSKSYGSSNGIIYAHRFSDNYYTQSVELNQDIIAFNKNTRLQFGNKFIDMLQPVMTDETHVRVFTDDKKFISQDCRHLTKAGAQYYAKIMNIQDIFNNNQD